VQLVFGLDPGADQGGRDERMKRKGEEEEERRDDPPLHVYARFTTGWIEFFFSERVWSDLSSWATSHDQDYGEIVCQLFALKFLGWCL